MLTILFTLRGVRHNLDASLHTAHIVASALARQHGVPIEVWSAATLVATIGA